MSENLEALRSSELIGRALDVCATALHGVIYEVVGRRIGEDWESGVLRLMETSPERDSVRDLSFQLTTIMRLWSDFFRDRYPPYRSNFRNLVGIAKSIRNDHAHRSTQPSHDSTRWALDILTELVREAAPELEPTITPLRDEALRRSAESVLATTVASVDGDRQAIRARLDAVEAERAEAAATAERAQAQVEEADRRQAELAGDLDIARRARAAAEAELRQLRAELDRQSQAHEGAPPPRDAAQAEHGSEQFVIERKLTEARTAIHTSGIEEPSVVQAFEALERLAARVRDEGTDGPPPTAQLAHLLVLSSRLRGAVPQPTDPDVATVASEDWVDDVVAGDPHLAAFRERIRATLPTG